MTQQVDTEVVALPPEKQSLTDMTDDLIQSAERRIASLQKIIVLALKVTNEHDWVDQQGKPYLQGSGAEKVARLFGVGWKDITTEKKRTEDENGPFYFYLTSGVFTLKGDAIHAVGTCSSKDQFFAKKKEKDEETGEWTMVLKPLSEVDETNIMKSAYTNCVVNGITRLLGLRNMTWEQLQEAGLKRDKVAGVKYGTGGAGGGKISKAQENRLFAILVKGAGSDAERKFRMETLKKFMSETHKIGHTAEIETKVYDAIVTQAEAISALPFTAPAAAPRASGANQ